MLKKNSLAYARNQIEQISISKAEKKHIVKKIKTNLNYHQTKEAHQNISNNLMSKKDSLVNQQYQKYLKDKGISSATLPPQISEKIRQSITRKVNHLLTQLSNTLVQIQQRIKKEYVQAFTKLYLYAAPFALVIAIIFFFIPVKSISLRRPNNEK